MKIKLAKIVMATLIATLVNNVDAIDSLIIQENSLGICTMDGIIENSQTGYTGDGYVNVNDGLNVGMSWSINVMFEGIYKIAWRYALGGSDTTSRDARLYVNNILMDTILFPHSGSTNWNFWNLTDSASVELLAGKNTIRLSSVTAKGLANIDYFVIKGDGITMSECVQSFTFSVNPCNSIFGNVTYSPIQDFYDIGTEITVMAKSNPGYFFHSWSGKESSIEDTFSFPIKENTNLTALFYSEGTAMADGASGYATVQHDNGTPYLLTGGTLGKTVEPETVEELKSFLSSEDTLVINVSKHFIGSGEIGIKSNKSLIGINDSAHIEGITMAVSNCRNIIFKNLTFSKVQTMDEMEINGAKNIWIDHCEFFTDRLHDKDYYDGLLDIKNASSFITVSWSNFHDHFKAILISSGDDSYQDSVQRITFHHNYFHDCGSRLPSIRFGKSHIFSNYYQDNDGAIHTRVGACVKVEHNYFKNVDGAIGQSQAYLDMETNTNIFDNSPYSTDIPPCTLNIPYSYEELIDSASSLPDLIPSNVRIFQKAESPIISNVNLDISEPDNFHFYPNPCSDNLSLSFNLKEPDNISIDVYSLYGRFLENLLSNYTSKSGLNKLVFDISNLDQGVYTIVITSQNNRYNKVLLKK